MEIEKILMEFAFYDYQSAKNTFHEPMANNY